MSGTDITLTAHDGGSFSAYLAAPESGAGAGIVVLQEIFGVNRVMRDIADGLAAQGYFAIVPDLFWRQQPGIQITDKTEAEWARAFELYQGFDENLGVDDAIAALDHLRTVPGCSGLVGSTGYCLGGKLAYLMAARSSTDATVGYYGVGIADALDEGGSIQRPLMLHIAEDDEFVPKEAQAQVKDALADNALVEIHSYPGLDHAFCRVGGAHYDAAGAALANERTAAFFAEHLA